MLQTVLIFIGGGLGAALRHWVGALTLRHIGTAFPAGTLFVNVFGSLLMGILIGWLARRSGVSNEMRLFLATGFLGGFTTFSAFSLDFANLWTRGETTTAFIYATASVVMSIFAVFSGLWLMRPQVI